MAKLLRSKYDVNTWYEFEEAIDIFRIRRLKEDPEKKKITVVSECDGIVVFKKNDKYMYQYRRGDPVAATHYCLIPCNIELFVAKFVNYTFQFYWK